MDLNFVSSSKIVNAGVSHERKEIVEAIRDVLNMMFVYDRPKHTTILKKEFEDELKAYVDRFRSCTKQEITSNPIRICFSSDSTPI